MSTYAQRADVEKYIEGWVTDDPFALERLIRRAEQQLDNDVLRRTRTELPPTQVISIIGATGGSYVLGWIDYNGNTNTVTLPFNATAAQIQSALQAFVAIGIGVTGLSNVAVLGTNPFTIVWDTDWSRTHYTGLRLPSIDFQIPLITIDGSLLTPSQSISVSVDEEIGRKINPLTDLDRNEQLGLARATCAQAEYRNAMGEAFFVRSQYQSVRGPDFSTQGKLSFISRKAMNELSNVGLLQWGGRAVVGWGRRGVARGWPTY